MPVAVGIQPLAHPAVLVVVGILHHLVHRRGVACAVFDLHQAVAVVPGVLGDVGIAAVELAVLVGVDEPVRAVPLGVFWKPGCGVYSGQNRKTPRPGLEPGT